MDRTMALVRLNVAEEEGLLLKYYLYEEMLDSRPSYSIECKCGDESAFLPDVTSLKERAVEIFELFVKSRVTPISARDVLEDILP